MLLGWTQYLPVSPFCDLLQSHYGLSHVYKFSPEHLFAALSICATNSAWRMCHIHTIWYSGALVLHPALMQIPCAPSLSARISFFIAPLHQLVYSIIHDEPTIHWVMRFEDTLFTVRTIIWSEIRKIGLNWSGWLGLFFPDSTFRSYLCVSHLPSAAMSDFLSCTTRYSR